jgi:hypothetical protein
MPYDVRDGRADGRTQGPLCLGSSCPHMLMALSDKLISSRRMSSSPVANTFQDNAFSRSAGWNMDTWRNMSFMHARVVVRIAETLRLIPSSSDSGCTSRFPTVAVSMYARGSLNKDYFRSGCSALSLSDPSLSGRLLGGSLRAVSETGVGKTGLPLRIRFKSLDMNAVASGLGFGLLVLPRGHSMRIPCPGEYRPILLKDPKISVSQRQ